MAVELSTSTTNLQAPGSTRALMLRNCGSPPVARPGSRRRRTAALLPLVPRGPTTRFSILSREPSLQGILTQILMFFFMIFHVFFMICHDFSFFSDFFMIFHDCSCFSSLGKMTKIRS